jgi:hypothetical protein
VATSFALSRTSVGQLADLFSEKIVRQR